MTDQEKLEEICRLASIHASSMQGRLDSEFLKQTFYVLNNIIKITLQSKAEKSSLPDEGLTSSTAIAQAIEGPYRAPPDGSGYTLHELRAIRWGMLTEQERRNRINQAASVVKLLRSIREN